MKDSVTKNAQHIAAVSLITLVLLVVWIILMPLSMAIVQPEIGVEEFIELIKTSGVPFILNYINAVLLTFSITLLFILLFVDIKSRHPVLAYSGLVFLVMFSLTNIMVYSSQFIILPELFRDGSSLNEEILLQLIHIRESSLIYIINMYAYGFLGVPSVLYGFILMKKNVPGMIAGLLLLLNGIFCWMGLISLGTGDRFTRQGTMIGAVAFIAAVFFLYLMYRRKSFDSKH
ncbi:MAG: hypothetical protein ACOC2K_03665 [Bacteroidota bacterium]